MNSTTAQDTQTLDLLADLDPLPIAQAAAIQYQPAELWEGYAVPAANNPVLGVYENLFADRCRVVKNPDQWNGSNLDDWIAIPLADAHNQMTGLAFLPPKPQRKMEFFPHRTHPVGGYVVLSPQQGQTVYVVEKLQDAGAIARAGLPAVASLTRGNLKYVVRAWLNAGHPVVSPVLFSDADEISDLLKDGKAKVLALEDAIYNHEPDELLIALTATATMHAAHPTAWLDPLPLREPDEAPTPYPLAAFPNVARQAIEAIEYYVQAPTALVGQCVLGTLAYVAQMHVNAPSMHNADGMPCSLFLLTEGASSDRKTGCHDLSDKVIKERERVAKAEYKAVMDDFNDGLSACTGKKERAEYLQDNSTPPNPQSTFTDATIELVTMRFIDGEVKNAAWTSDEAGQFFDGATMKGDNANSALGALTKIFDKGMVERNRSKSNINGSGSAYDIRLMFNLLGQREILQKVINDPVLRGQGFLPRFIFAAPDSRAGDRPLTFTRMNEKAYLDPRLQAFWAHYGQLIPDPADPVSKAEFNRIYEQPRPVLDMTEGAARLWLDFFNHTESQQRVGERYEHMRPFAGRSGELARRVATIFAFIEHKTQIDLEAMRGACALVQYSLDEWLRYSDLSSQDKNLTYAESVEAWLIVQCTNSNSDGIPIRTAYQKVTTRAARGKEDLLKCLQPLIEHQRARIENRNGTQFITINPKLLN